MNVYRVESENPFRLVVGVDQSSLLLKITITQLHGRKTIICHLGDEKTVKAGSLCRYDFSNSNNFVMIS